MQLPATQHSRGFTLIELMVVVVIATILVALALPSYLNQLRQARRTEAKTSLLDLAGREERYFSTSAGGASYSATAADLGYAGAFPQVVGSGYYTVSVCVAGTGAAPCPPSAAPGPMYTITATPVAGTSQASDAQCVSFSVDSVGQQYVGAASTQTPAYCWGN